MTILHLEDNSNDAELARHLLLEQWPEVEIRVATNRDEFLTDLARRDQDLILSDFSLIGFDGIEALRLARERAPEIPFIFFSGKIGEDRAIEAVQAGAQDYVLKDRVKRLVTAIQRTLDQTQERRRLRAIEAERGRLAATLENTPDFVGLCDPDGTVLYLNLAARRMLQVEKENLPADLKITALHPPELVHRVFHENLRTAEVEGTWSGESVLLTREGRTIPVSQIIVAHRGPGGRPDYYSTVMRDLTAHKQTEAMVHGQNQILEMIAGGEPLGDTLTALLRFIESQSGDMFCSILMLEEDGTSLRHCAAPRLAPEFIAAIDGQPIGPSQGSCGTAAYRRAPVVVSEIATDPLWSGYRQEALAQGFRACWSSPIFDVHHRLLGTFAVYLQQPGKPTEQHRQLTDIGSHIAAICLSRFHTERQLRSQAEILNKASDAIIATDLNGRITLWNQGAERTFGWTAAEAIGRQENSLVPAEADNDPELAAKQAQEEEWRREVRQRDRQGNTHVMETRVTLIRNDAGQAEGRLSIATDVTDKKRIEEQFFRAQRLESIGMLAAGIAHDLNNVLAPILLAAPMLRDHATDPGDLRMISTLEKSAERGAGLVRQILSFAHGADGDHRLIQAKHLLRDVASFVEETFPKSITLDAQIPSDLWPIRGNPTQVHQVLLNFCVNARDAMPHGGTLTLLGENCVIDEITASEIEGAYPGAFLVFHVQDTGTGIPPDVLVRIWEPFYTTKESGKGTGLGLSTVRGIVESHGGFATVHTVEGRGTTFRVYFQTADNTAGIAGIGAVAPAAARGTGELVLIVDDEPGIRNMAAAILARHGYRVLTAADGAEAIALFAPRSKEIRLVITDLSMPNLDGTALASVVQRINPAVKIIAMSGHTTEDGGELPENNFTQAFLIKPFRPEALLTSVHEHLRAPPPPPP